MAPTRVGPLLKEWRTYRRCSQMDLAHAIGVSPRHLSFVETGRSRPSPELVLAIADGLEVPVRERNSLLLAAGYAPQYTETSLDEASMAEVRGWLERMLAAHDPYPGVVIDRCWDVVLANGAASRLLAGLPPEVAGPRMNVFRVCLHPNGLAGRTLNLNEWGGYLLRQLRRMANASNDAALRELEQEVSAYPTVSDVLERHVDAQPPLLVPLRLATDGPDLSLFTTLTTFGTPVDITLSEIALELFYPADASTEVALRAAAA